ncbi:flavin-containing monooxygenase [Lacipirellula limnantheis]|uniref:4-hydroxyacetophenone monooxygenase n=1 Tax=Lacipirellula limnantheis TaxID=2528024 RepID=A0A517U5U6_9BACT|nr:NAD(P)-binding domain-containing protein [Lacipirellula limnantheis]QDT76005.1 4-hydroxyacetophenone monooxygenase [Lacipirellula limnantheis]
MDDRSEKFCIIGAGSSGIAAAKNFLAAGIPFDCLEREDDIGGNWYFGAPCSRVYASTHLVSSKVLTEYSDFPMPQEWPEYPSHRQALRYLREYARAFGLYERIEFGTGVEGVEPAGVGSQESGGSGTRGGPLGVPQGDRVRPRGDSCGRLSGRLGVPRRDLAQGWIVRLANGEERRYRGVVIANGHNWDPRWPEYPGEFTGETIHSAQFKTGDVLRGQRVLVVGGGNSGCDIACEAALHAESAVLSTRRAYHVLPKFFRGRPIDQCNELLLWLRVPLWARRAAGAVVSHVALGPAWRTGVPKPDHRLFESHPILNSQIHHHVGHGRLGLRPDVERFDGQTVTFIDGSAAEFDLVIYATGYRVTIPFIDRAHLNWQDESPRLFMNVFHPERDDLFCIGLIQPDSGQFGLVDYQAQLVANYLSAMEHRPARAEKFRRLKASETPDLGSGVRYVSSPRHTLEVEHYSYRRRLQKLAASLR